MTDDQWVGVGFIALPFIMAAWVYSMTKWTAVAVPIFLGALTLFSIVLGVLLLTGVVT